MLQLLMVVTCCLAFLLAACIVPWALALLNRVRSSSLRCDFVQLGGWQKNCVSFMNSCCMPSLLPETPLGPEPFHGSQGARLLKRTVYNLHHTVVTGLVRPYLNGLWLG